MFDVFPVFRFFPLVRIVVFLVLICRFSLVLLFLLFGRGVPGYWFSVCIGSMFRVVCVLVFVVFRFSNCRLAGLPCSVCRCVIGLVFLLLVAFLFSVLRSVFVWCLCMCFRFVISRMFRVRNV